jgi:biofilm PGA synthesis N-glycosyltransferase PgaC
MYMVALIIALISYVVVFGTYAFYIVFVLRNHKTEDYVRSIQLTLTKRLDYAELPNVTAIIPMYNEEAVIAKKLQNMTELDYPIEKIQVLLIDDCSSDNTCAAAEKTVRELKLNGKIIRNSKRMGANASYNTGVANADSNLILRTDADVMINTSSLRKAVQVISSNGDIGAVTGMMEPVYDTNTAATTMEKQYRNLFDQMSIAESALHSTYPGGGGFTLIKKSAFSPISVDQGSTDGNVSLSIIRQGFRHVYVPESFSLELVSKRLGDQLRQKVRRARRVIQSTVMNKGFMFNKKYGKFGTLIFPFRFLMFAVCPFFVFTGMFSTFYLLFSYSFILGGLSVILAFLLFLLGTRIKLGVLNSVVSVLAQQFYLVIGLFLLPKRSSTWKSIKRQK